MSDTNKMVSVALTMEEWSFIASGLKDLSNFACKRKFVALREGDFELVLMEQDLQSQNMDLALHIEGAVFSRPGVE